LKEDQLTKMILETNRLHDKDKPWTVYFSDKKAPRSLKQNKYYWGVVLKKISDHTGYEAEELHEMFKAKFGIVTKFDGFDGELIEYARSTKFFDTRQFSEYIDKIREFAQNKIGVYIPQPNEITDEDYINSQAY
jgi:hypothetical protein